MSARYNPRKDHSVRRRAGFKPVKKTFLIVCEGVNTEPEYFNAFRLTSATVKAISLLKTGRVCQNVVSDSASFSKQSYH